MYGQSISVILKTLLVYKYSYETAQRPFPNIKLLHMKVWSFEGGVEFDDFDLSLFVAMKKCFQQVTDFCRRACSKDYIILK